MFSSGVLRVVAIILIVVLSALWIVLVAPFTRDFRVGYVEAFLSGQLGEPVHIDGDVRLSLSPNFAIAASRLRLPAADFDDRNLAELGSARIALFSPTAVVAIPRIEASDILITFFKDSEGRTTWDNSASTPSANDAALLNLLGFFGARDVELSGVKLSIVDEGSGFEFLYEMTEFKVSQDEAGANLASAGHVNGAPYQIGGRFPDGGPFDASAEVGGVIYDLAGASVPQGAPGEFEADLSVTSQDIAQLFEVLRLDTDLAGAARLTARLSSLGLNLTLDDIDLNVSLDNGATAGVTGRLSRIEPQVDLTVEMAAGDDREVEYAYFWEDLRLTRLEARLVGESGRFALRDMKAETNDFRQELREIGPIEVGRLGRTADDKLQLRDVTIPFGPSDAPVAVLRGGIDDLLNTAGYTLEGELDLPATFVLDGLVPEAAKPFGRAVGQMRLSDASGAASLETLEVSIEGSPLWSGTMSAQVNDIAAFEGILFTFVLDLEDSDGFLGGLKLNPLGAGPVSLAFDASRNDDSVSTVSSIGLGASALNATLMADVEDDAPRINGRVYSDAVAWTDLLSTIDLVRELTREGNGLNAVVGRDGAPKKEDDTSEADEVPAALGQSDPVALLKRTEIDIGVAIARITGLGVLSRLDTSVALRDGVLESGAVPLSFGPGRATVSARSDLTTRPLRTSLAGTTTGWDLGDTLDELLTLGIAADGNISGEFQVSGPVRSLNAFLNGLSGSANLGLVNGRLATSYVELAGLGIIPWLFSRERSQGWTQIDCARLPLKLSPGRIDITEGVVETRRVQVVASGFVDFAEERVSLSADPRPVGQPLGPNAFPFSVSGSLNKPTVGLDKITRRVTERPLVMPADRKPCVPDVRQLQEAPGPRP